MGLIFVSRPDSLFYICVSAQELGKETHSWINLYSVMILELKCMLRDGAGIAKQPKFSLEPLWENTWAALSGQMS